MYKICAFVLTKPAESNLIEARNSIKSLAAFDQSEDKLADLKIDSNGSLKMQRSSDGQLSNGSAKTADMALPVVKIEDERAAEGQFDEINVESELTRTHTERREPNGTTYFVERQGSDEQKVLDFLDNVIDSRLSVETEMVQTPGALSNDIVELPIETVALVHRENDQVVQKVEDVEEEIPVKRPLSMEDNDSGILVVSQMSLNESKSAIGSSVNLAREKEQSMSDENLVINDNHPVISHLAGTKTLPLNKSHKHEYKKMNTMGPVKASKSDTDLRTSLFEEIKRFRKSDDDEDEFKDNEVAAVPVNEGSPIEARSPTIPVPPVFDREKFDQAGTIPRPKTFSPVSSIPKTATLKKRKAPSPPTPLKFAEDTATDPPTPLDEDNNNKPETTLSKSSPNFTTFKNRLEAIYSRGPPSLFVKATKPKPKSSPGGSISPAESNPDSPAVAEAVTSPEEEIKLAKFNLKPLDTVHRQKLLFNDVLKSIQPDTRPSDHKHEGHSH